MKDSKLKQDVIDELTFEPSVEAALNGAVNWHYQRNAADEAVRALGGVLGVSNEIESRPHLYIANIKQHIEEALILKGTVTTWAERNAAERAAWSSPGVSNRDQRHRHLMRGN